MLFNHGRDWAKRHRIETERIQARHAANHQAWVQHIADTQRRIDNTAAQISRTAYDQQHHRQQRSLQEMSPLSRRKARIHDANWIPATLTNDTDLACLVLSPAFVSWITYQNPEVLKNFLLNAYNPSLVGFRAAGLNMGDNDPSDNAKKLASTMQSFIAPSRDTIGKIEQAKLSSFSLAKYGVEAGADRLHNLLSLLPTLIQQSPEHAVTFMAEFQRLLPFGFRVMLQQYVKMHPRTEFYTDENTSLRSHKGQQAFKQFIASAYPTQQSSSSSDESDDDTQYAGAMFRKLQLSTEKKPAATAAPAIKPEKVKIQRLLGQLGDKLGVSGLRLGQEDSCKIKFDGMWIHFLYMDKNKNLALCAYLAEAPTGTYRKQQMLEKIKTHFESHCHTKEGIYIDLSSDEGYIMQTQYFSASTSLDTLYKAVEDFLNVLEVTLRYSQQLSK